MYRAATIRYAKTDAQSQAKDTLVQQLSASQAAAQALRTVSLMAMFSRVVRHTDAVVQETDSARAELVEIQKKSSSQSAAQAELRQDLLRQVEHWRGIVERAA